ncbi:hypothetical protein [Paenibacillus lupini]|uniref:hypothetical protein n=1 Tax=Paenibacillus lupini TaxID=1450204 RepID=UPI001424845C|nr:hypothetical protein [Paenibacillus lupini]NIK25257.1 hypothetical protein [Paenibacillus lupini]
MLVNKRLELIRRKISLMEAKKILENFQTMNLINVEDTNSIWVEGFQPLLRETRKYESVPTNSINKDQEVDFLEWIKEQLTFLKDINEWLIAVPNVNDPVWASVLVNDSSAAITELWTKSENHEFVIAIKSIKQIAVIYNEEHVFEVHVKK